jgi:tricorn protease
MLLTTFLAFSAPQAFMRYPTVSRDQIAFVHADQVWIAPRAGGAPVELTQGPGTKSCLHFSADGQSLAFTSDAEGNESIYVLNLSDHKLVGHGVSLEWARSAPPDAPGRSDSPT